MNLTPHSAIRTALGALLVLPVLIAGALARPGDPVPAAVAAPTGNSMGPVAVAGVSIDNFGVVDGRIFRGEQPAKGDYAALAALGVKTVVDLREDARKDSQALAEAAGLRYVNIPMKGTGGTPTDEQAAAFLKVVDDPASGSVYVHCAGGRHRTGSMIAVYRMTHDGWTIEQAYGEMLAYDFYTRNGHTGFKTYVFDFYERFRAGAAESAARVHPSHPARDVVADAARR